MPSENNCIIEDVDNEVNFLNPYDFNDSDSFDSSNDDDGLELFTFDDNSLLNEHVGELHDMLCDVDDELNVDASLLDLNDVEFDTFHDNCIDDAIYIHDLIGEEKEEMDGDLRDVLIEEVHCKIIEEEKEKTRNESVSEEVEDKESNYLDLSDNLFSGNIPECLGQYAGNDLGVLNLANNNLSGEIPSSLGYLNQISSLHLRNTGLFGELPISLKNCTSLRILDLGENELSGDIPVWIGESLNQLKVLYLHSNELKGSIPTSICQLQSMRVLDLSSNNFYGPIPTCFSNYSTAMTQMLDEWFLDEAHFEDTPLVGILNTLHYFIFDFELVMWKGKEAEYRENLKFLKLIDLSNNRLVGEIPVDLTNLHGLISLNLSKNNLTRSIPYRIGEMNSLEILDLSQNQLFGAIPVSMANLSFLAVLDLSNNNLSGCIPLGTQLQGFTEAYQGNPQLRGLPLQTKCQSSKQGNDDFVEEEHWILLDLDFFLSMTIGFILGFWGVCGTLIVKHSWRHAFFQFLEDKKDYIYLFIVSHGTKLKRSMGGMLKK
nr:receptor-like protein 12 isoform X1 [Ipomoea batatas]